MKAEHRDYIDRAALHGCLPSVLAHELLAHDLVNAALFELKNIHAPYPKLNEGQQQEVIERITEKVEDAVRTAIGIISSRNVTTIEMTMKEVKFNSKQLTLTSIVDAKNPERHQLIDSAGHLCLLVMAPHDYNDGLDFIQPDRDQREMPLHVSDLTGSLFEQPVQLGTKEELAAHIAAGKPVAESDSDEELSTYDDTLSEGEDPLYSEAVLFVTESRRPTISAIQRKLKIGYNRAARILEAMEQAGLVTAPNTNGMREVLVQQPPSRDDSALVGKEFGDYSYEEAAQVIVLKAQDKGFKAHWVQSRLAVSSDQVTTLLLRLIDNGVIAVETEGESALEHSYKVIATLEQVV